LEYLDRANEYVTQDILTRISIQVVGQFPHNKFQPTEIYRPSAEVGRVSHIPREQMRSLGMEMFSLILRRPDSAQNALLHPISWRK
jgi:hypothetical protein